MDRRDFFVRSVVSFVVFVIIFPMGCKKTEPPFECTDAIGCVTIAPGEPIKLGVLQPLTGRMAALGTGQIRGVELALANRTNKLLGHPVELGKNRGQVFILDRIYDKRL